jgi:hypothetical protein
MEVLIISCSLCYQNIINNNWKRNEPLVKKGLLGLHSKRYVLNMKEQYYEFDKNIQNLGNGDFIDY